MGTAGSVLQKLAIPRAGLVVVLLGSAAIVAGCGNTQAASDTGSNTTSSKQVVLVTDADGYSCDSDETRYGLCPKNPLFGKTTGQAHAVRVARAKAKARALARAKARARARARARAAYLARLNAWHRGYYLVDASDGLGDPIDGFYARWVRGSCQDFAEYGCWHVQVISATGCSSYVAVEANEYLGNSVVNDLLDNNGTGLPPKTSETFELEASQDGTTANDLKAECD
jgi:hypothetical protein